MLETRSRDRGTIAAVVVLCLVSAVSGQRGPNGEALQPQGGGRGFGPRAGGPGGGGVGPLGGRARGRGDAPTGTALIRGRVTTQDTGAPVRRAQVRATTSGVPFGRLATTDADGQFELRDLPAGPWSLTAAKPGFVSQRLGQRRPFETVAPVELREGQQLSGANFALPRGGAITGRLLDDFGDPVANARVLVLRSQMVEGLRRLTQTGSGDETDDTGAFRLYGLAPGDYYVAATLRAAPQDLSPDRAGYAPTYFPGTGNAGEAQRVRLGVGEEQSVTFSLLPVRTVRISGTVVSAAGTAPSNGVVALTSTDSDELGVVMPTGGQIQANGAFTISNAAPGSYVLNVRTGVGRGGGGPRNNPEAEVGSVSLVVGGDDDMTGVTIVTTKGASVEGAVVGDTGARPPLDNVRVTARPLRVSAQPLGGRASQSPVAANGTFALSSLVGPVSLRVDGLPQSWVVKSVEVSGDDVTDTGLDLKGTEQITGARITVTDKVTELNGTATSGGATAKDYSVVVFAEDQARWTFPTRFVRTARGNQQGTFSLRGLPPGTRYLAAAVSSIDDGEAQDPEFLNGLRERASAVSLRDGEAKTIDLRVIER